MAMLDLADESGLLSNIALGKDKKVLQWQHQWNVCNIYFVITQRRVETGLWPPFPFSSVLCFSSISRCVQPGNVARLNTRAIFARLRWSFRRVLTSVSKSFLSCQRFPTQVESGRAESLFDCFPEGNDLSLNVLVDRTPNEATHHQMMKACSFLCPNEKNMEPFSID